MGAGVWYSLFIKNLTHYSWVINQNKTNYSLTVKKVSKESDYSLFINFFVNSLKK